MIRSLTAVLIREGDGFVALCPEVDVASQGDTVEEAKKNLREAVELFFECASPQEIADRLSTESFVSSLEVNVPRLPVLSGAEVCRILEENEFVQVRQKGSHVIMQLRTASSTITVPVPNHKELRIGTEVNHQAE